MKKFLIAFLSIILFFGIAAIIYAFVFPTTQNDEPPLRVVADSSGGGRGMDVNVVSSVGLLSYLLVPGGYSNKDFEYGGSHAYAFYLLNTDGTALGFTPTNLGWIGIAGYPSSAENLFENSESKALYVKENGSTYATITTGNGMTDMITLGTEVRVTNVVISTQSTNGTVGVKIANKYTILKIYCSNQQFANSGEIRQLASLGDIIRVERDGFVGSEETFVSVTVVNR